ncbi:hypothetical protein [Natrinema sp. DC36]|uniref:hypothetical protein n=1 Tax=Natrinema sp. DC36 TaxID=2878680 RepID=UPI001CF027E7|nr:hypothetical protein [Natrinema sp. DC36]
MPVTFTTDVPDIDSLSLDASVAEEITAAWNADLNNGEYRLELRDDDPSGDHPPYELETTVPFNGTLEHTIANILGGEQYSVRVRVQTEFVTGEWMAAEEITKLIASDSITFDAIAETSVGLSWSINNDFRGSHQIFRRRADYDYDGQGRLVGSVGSDLNSFVDDSVAPDREYDYEVRTLTQWQYADSESASTTTDSIGLKQHTVPPRGWHAEVDHPSGTPLTPQVLDGAVRRPTINGYPRVEIPVPFRDRWHAEAFDDAPLRVWNDGDREPIEVLEHRSLEEGSGSKQTVLEGRGGTQLDDRVVEDVDIQPTHEFVRYLLDTYTDYNYTVDDPQADQEPTTLQTADTNLELNQAVAEAVRDALADDTIPLEFTDDGRINPLQTCEVVVLSGGNADDQYVGGEAGEAATVVSFDGLDYTIPSGEVGVAVRVGLIGSDPPTLSFEFGGTLLTDTYSPSSRSSPGWFEVGAFLPSDYSYDGTSTNLLVDIVSSGSDNYPIDVAVIFDKRYHDRSAFDNDVHEPGGHLDSPTEYAETIPIDLEVITTPLAISDLSLEVTMADGQAAPELALGENGTETWNTATDTTSHSITYSELATTARGRVSVGYDDTLSARDATPRYGYEPQALDSLTLEATLDSTPVLTNRSFDGKLIQVMREVFGIGNFVSEARWEDGGITIEVTQLGQREASVDPDIADYSIDRQTEDVVERAVVYGGAQQITRQSVTVTVGSWVDLPFPDTRIVDGKETIYDGSTEYSRGDDYGIRYTTQDGQPQIKALSGGSLSDGQTVSVDAEVKPRGEFTAGDVVDETDAKTLIEDIPGLASKQMCDQVALFAVEETGDAIVDASVTIPHDSVEWSLVDAIDPDRLPGDGPWQVNDISPGESETSVELGNGQSADEFLEEVNDRTKRNSERV